MEKLVITNFQAKKNKTHQEIVALYLSLPHNYSRNQRVMYVARKFERSDTGIIKILKTAGVYGTESKEQAHS